MRYITEASSKVSERLERKLDLVLKMLAIDRLYGKTLTEQVDILTQFGINSSDIATILGTKADVVGALQRRLKKRRGK